jgi:hypothetical protein
MKQILSKKIILIIVIALLITLGMNFIATPAAYASTNFYYIGTTGGSYTTEASIFTKIINALGAMFDYIIGLKLFAQRMIIVGWIALFEWVLVILVDKLCATDMSGANGEVANTFEGIENVFDSIKNVSNRITFEKIIFNQIGLFNANVFDFGNEHIAPSTP